MSEAGYGVLTTIMDYLRWLVEEFVRMEAPRPAYTRATPNVKVWLLLHKIKI